MTKLQAPENDNYAATVVKLTAITPLEGRDNIVGTPIYGFQAIVSKSTQVGDIGIVFPAETKLAEEYARENNMYQHGDLNKDESAKGYISDSGRVKAIKLGGHRSDALFMPLSSLEFTGFDVSTLEVGDTFDELNGHKICSKFVRKQVGTPRIERNKEKKFVRVEQKFLPEHYDSENYWRNKHVIKGNKRIVVTQKLHGTSIRIGNTVVKRKLTWLENLAKKVGVNVQETEYDYVYGSRKVIKDINNPNQNHFYGTDIWTEEGKKLDGLLPEGFIVYGELIGWTGQTAIQKNYTYQIPQGTANLYVYRVATVTPQGRLIDLSWEQVKEFCKDLGLKHVPELWTGLHKNFDVDKYIDKKFAETMTGDLVPLDEKSPCDEGVCIRVDGIAPYILKAKSPMFLQHETKMLDEEATDLEAEGSEVDETTE